MAKDKPRNSGQWTESRFQSFIKGNLRRASMRWGPISECLKQARVARGEYRCSGCDAIVPATIRDPESGKRIKGIVVDHTHPVIDPCVGFTTWDSVIDRLFVEVDKLQALCHTCHKTKTDAEKAQAKERRTNEKE